MQEHGKRPCRQSGAFFARSQQASRYGDRGTEANVAALSRTLYTPKSQDAAERSTCSGVRLRFVQVSSEQTNLLHHSVDPPFEG